MSWKTILLGLPLFVLLTVLSSWAAQRTVLLSVLPNNNAANVEIVGGVWEKEGSADVLKVSVANEDGLQKVMLIKNPGISEKTYILQGRLRSEVLPGQGYLEMLSTFPNGQSFFSRTLSESGPQAKLQGNFNWRFFSLPFEMSSTSTAPQLLTFNIKAPQGSLFYFSDLRLMQAESLDEGWLTRKELGLLGGIFGTLMGCIGALIGILSSRGKAKNFVRTLTNACLTIGAGLLIMGVVAVLRMQPEYMFMSLLLSGAFLILLFAGVRKTIYRAYQEAELRRMQAQDTP